jgi:polyhydroxyalkanoate synthase
MASSTGAATNARGRTRGRGRASERATQGRRSSSPQPETASAAAASAPAGGAHDWWATLGQTSFAPSRLPQVAIAPARLLELQQSYAQRLNELWRDFLANPQKAAEPIKDPRFADEAWRKNPLASFYARAYLLNADFMNQLADSVEADRKTKRRVKFAVQQWVEAAAPSNFLALNPRAQELLLASKGESLTQGLANLLKDISRGKITQTDETAFEVGKNVATTEGGVVYENALMQLIQYKPLTDKVYRRPFVIIPPCINKYYILDLQPDNSFIRYCVEQGHTVFVVSWKNPHEPEARMTWDDYLELGPIAAIDVAREISGEDKVNALGFCVGGTIVATALAVMYARGDDPITSLTLLTALLDFEDTGVLDVFVDEAHVRMREQTIGQGGLMPGLELNNTFASLRPNDLVWNYVVNNYLEGKQPPPFDLLYWNGDSTNLPGPMYVWYLRNMYLENNLRVPGKLVCCGERVDLNTIRVPAYVFAAREDHIVPWKAAYASARLLPGDGPGSVKFVLGASGHIAGTINPPSKNKRSFWTAPPAVGLPANSDAWLHAATEHPGSWWPDFAAWLKRFGGGEVSAPRKLGSAKYRVIEPAPGRYVKEKA